jgi:hypothetical protein
MGADYAWPVPGHASLDDLILMTGHLYHESLARSALGVQQQLSGTKAIITIENATTSEIARTILVSRTNARYESTSQHETFLRYPEDKYLLASALLMAVDLRVMAFVVRQKYSEYPYVWASDMVSGSAQYDNGLHAMRIQTYMLNAVVDEIVMEPVGSEIDARLVGFFADASVTGLHRMPITESGVVSDRIYNGSTPATLNAYWSLSLSNVGPYAPYIGPGPSTQPAIRVGAVAYALYVAEQLNTRAQARFAIHPNGSWSITTKPISYFPGPLPSSGIDGGNSIADQFDIGGIRSALVDLVSIREKPDAEEVKTTHLALLNESLKSAYTAADFLPKYEKHALAQGSVFTTYLVDTSSGRAFALEEKTSNGSGWIHQNLLDLDFQTTTVFLWAWYVGPLTPTPMDRTPVLGGSAIFI